MSRKTLTKIAFTAVVAPALAFGAPTVALADSFFHGSATSAGPYGAASHNVTSAAWDGFGHGYGHGGKHGHAGKGHHGHHGHAGKGHRGHHGGFYGGHGGSFFKKQATSAGPYGAASHKVASAAR